jgi:hypothetical protein
LKVEPELELEPKLELEGPAPSWTTRRTIRYRLVQLWPALEPKAEPELELKLEPVAPASSGVMQHLLRFSFFNVASKL